MPPSILSLIEEDCTPDVARVFTAVATDYLAETCDRSERVTTRHTPAELAHRFAEPMPRTGRPVSEIVARLREQVIPDSNHLYHPRYIGHQICAPLPAAVWTESLTAALNQSMLIWEMSPVGTVLEHQVVRWMCDLVGYPETASGTLTSGGTEATFTALLAARSVTLPNAWTDGVGATPPALVCSESAHYSVTRAAGVMGFGVNNVVVVPDSDRCMDSDALRQTLDNLEQAGRRVMAVSATAGTTATGTFDDLTAIGKLCDDRGIWLHVDAAHGGSALLSERHRYRVRGLEYARSVTIDPHKMMFLPLQAGLLLVRDGYDLDSAFAQRAPYVFHGARDGRVWDQGVHSLLCSRRADIFKLWVVLQRYGADGLGALYDHQCEVALALHNAVAEHPDFTTIHEPECNILCFRYVGPHGRSEEQLDELNKTLRERYNMSGKGWISSTVLEGRRVLRAVIMNPRTTTQDVREVIAELGQLARELDRD